MNEEFAEVKISNLEQRIDLLAQEVAQGKQGDNVQNAQIPPFVPIPRITGEDQKPFDIETDDDDAKSVVRCIFYWGKEEVELADYSLDEIPATGNATLYLTRTISEGEPVYALTTDEPEESDEDTAYYKIYDFADGEVSCDYRATFITLGISAKFVGDMEGSEVIDAANDQILVTGHPGEEDAQGQDSHSGIMFLTVSGRTGQGGEKIPAKIIARIKDKDENEDWGAKTLTVNHKDGSQEYIHFLGCDDITVSEGENNMDVVGGDYIEVEHKTDKQGNLCHEVEAKTETKDTYSETEHALLTHDTDQFVRSKKTFIGDGAANESDRIVVDGPNAKLTTKSADGTKTVEIDASTGVETITNGDNRIVLDPSQIPSECQQKTIKVKTLTVTHPRAKTVDGQQVTSETYHILGCDDVDINEGDAIDKVESGTSTQSDEYTITPVTITLKDGTVLPAFNIKAKNGSGEKGDDGASVTGATAGTPVVSENTTTTPITFTLSDGTTVGPVNVVSTNGVEASGSDYIDVGDGTGGTTKGQVKAKVPTDGTTGLVTTDTAQRIEGSKVFARAVYIRNLEGNDSARYLIVENANNETRAYLSNEGLYLDRNNGSSSISFRNYNRNVFAQISFGHTYGNLTLTVLDGAGSGVRNKVKLNIAPNDETNTTTLTVPTMGWVNDKFLRIANLVADGDSSGISITPDTTNPKKLKLKNTGIIELVEGYNITLTPDEDDPRKVTIEATQPKIPDIEVDTSAITSGKAIGGLTVDATNKHKIIASAVDIPAEQVNADWNATSGKAQILNKPGSLKNPNALTIKKSGSADVVYDGSAAKTITLESGGATLDHSFSWEGTKKADIAASADIAVDSKTIQGSGGITVTEQNRVITISGSGSQVSGYTTPDGTYDYEVTGQEWDATNHRIVIHKVKKTYENGLLKTREAVADEYIQFVEETV